MTKDYAQLAKRISTYTTNGLLFRRFALREPLDEPLKGRPLVAGDNGQEVKEHLEEHRVIAPSGQRRHRQGVACHQFAERPDVVSPPHTDRPD